VDLFHKIDGAVAIVRGANCVEKQVDMFRRGERVYVPVSGGFVRICARNGGEGQPFGTSHPRVSVIAFEAEGVTLKSGLEPRFSAPLKAVA
jgi:hypothetical protein